MIIDAHVHLGPLTSYRVPDTGMETMLRLMDALEIEQAINMQIGGLMECFEEAYAESQDAYERSGGRFPYALSYNPLYPEDSLKWIVKALDCPGFVGLKIHPGQQRVYPEDDRYERVWLVAAAHGLPIISHSWARSDTNPTQKFATPEHFERWVVRYPQVSLILGHAGGRHEGHLAAAELAKRFPNVYVDLSGDVYPLGFLEWIVGQIGPGRVLFASDMVFCDPRPQLGIVLNADLTVEEKGLILRENALRLFNLAERCLGPPTSGVADPALQ